MPSCWKVGNTSESSVSVIRYGSTTTPLVLEPIWPSRLYWWPARVPRRSTSSPSPALTKTALRSSSKRRKKAVTGTPSARDSACSVVSDGEVMPFSIFDSMPSEMSVATARSATVMPSFLRNARTSRPIATSSTFSLVSRTACGFWVSGGRIVRPSLAAPFNDGVFTGTGLALCFAPAAAFAMSSPLERPQIYFTHGEHIRSR